VLLTCGAAAAAAAVRRMRTMTVYQHGGHHHQLFLDAVRCGDARQLRHLLDPEHQAPLTTTTTTTASRGPRGYLVNIDVFASDGLNALHHCCRAGNLELVKLLVSYGADVRLATRDGWTPLHIAVGAGHQDVVRFLLNAYRR